jgi:CDP-glucose 4,6-dehydratase
MDEMVMSLLQENYHNKTVLVTGHTGFKGSWLSAWLVSLGAKVIGYSIDIPTEPDHFKLLELDMVDIRADIRDKTKLKEVVETYQPEFIFHLAAQPIVSTSYSDPLETLSTNILGTATMLDVLKEINYDCTAIMITSDKCYHNVEWEWGYRENDRLGGKDIYSASKAGAEIIYHAYFESFLKNSSVKTATVRAGNVIGGGDWAKDRIVVDAVQAWANDESVEIRSPNATRPWQHVLEPLSGYLHLAVLLSKDNTLNGESYNFGPKAEQNRKVVDLITDLSNYWELKEAYRMAENANFGEANLLKLSCDKALSHLGWQPTLSYDETVETTSKWYFEFYKNKNVTTKDQIEAYEKKAKERGLPWA